MTKRISRNRQSGGSSIEDIEELQNNKQDLETNMAGHQKIARESLQYTIMR